ncbi:amidohydrolase [Paeniglutamicibacter antarcticus]|uniref:Amidohydrolase n=1 Tax=Arthrobacter terrae TaxID=2935737 RepID=A0A931GC54_9MICC|nr:M20 family metallopeptidase [Arthrobacter terrae]MBG0741402.1 amidohydrolase [Arthrobacter terrae]
MKSFREDAGELLPDLVRIRRLLHSNPEVGLVLPDTQQTVLAEIDGFGLDVHTGTDTTSVVAVLHGERPGPTVLLRGDMDALPVSEETGLEFASTNGRMHACGHDLHTAGLIGAARLLSARKADIAGDVVFMFQPGEEGYGGAAVMIKEGLLDVTGSRPVAAYAIHVGPGPMGVFHTRRGPFLAGSNELRITVHGEGGHGSRPESARDPVPAVAEIVTALQTMVTRQFSVFDPIVVTVTQLSAGQAINVIPPHASLGATVRTLSAQSLELLKVETTRLADGIAAAHGCTADIDLNVIYPVTVTDPEVTGAAMAQLSDMFGADRVVEQNEPVMGSEDFSFVLNEVPGSFFMLTCSPQGVDPTTLAYNHSPRVLFDDAVLGDQAAALAHLAFTRLSGTDA